MNDAVTLADKSEMTGLTFGGDIKEMPPLMREAVGLAHRQYQQEGIEFLWQRKRAMITDAPGLGKTPQGALASEPPAIIVAPTYLTGQWADWLTSHFPTRKAKVAKGNRYERMDIIRDASLDFLIINKEMMRTHIDELEEVASRFKTIVFDESHHLRNRTAVHSQGAASLARKIPRCYLLSATPIWKEVDDLFQQLHIMFPTVFSSYWEFVDRWCIADTDRFGTKVVGVKKSQIKELEELLDVIRLGRTYTDAGRSLPPIIENVLKVDFDQQARKMYDDVVHGFRLKFQDQPEIMIKSHIEVLHTLRQITAHHKTDAIKSIIEDTEPYHKGRYVVFTWYKDYAWRLAEDIGAKVVTGDFTPDGRRERAQSGDPIVATISSLSEGVDLSHMRMVIFAEEHWPPGSNVQALARVRRERIVEGDDSADENREPVLTYYVQVSDSIDSKIHEITRRRSASVRELMSEALDLY